MADPTVGTKNIWPNYASGNTSAAKEKGDTSLGKDDFIKILITQLKNQDPMQPMEDREFISQMAQFSSVEQIMNMATEMKLMRQSLGLASGLIDKQISWIEANNTNADGSAILSGVVESIIVRDGEQYAKIGAKEVKLSDIVEIGNVVPSTPSAPTGTTTGATDTTGTTP